ncbi:MAG: N-formylglutamate amidohydrolase [Candidatus Binatia bacterium]
MNHTDSMLEIINPTGRFPLVLTCEHASYALPQEYSDLGISTTDIQRHIGWDIGARTVVAQLARVLDAPAVCSRYSRLLVDCNRDVSDHDLIVPESDRTIIPSNRDLSEKERQKRIEQFYRPYHDAIDRTIAEHKENSRLALLSIHSFTPVLERKERPFDFGVLFDRYEDLAEEMGKRLDHNGNRVRYNEPYSGYEGLIFSARSHGEKNGIVYLELEINNSLITTAEGARRITNSIATVCQALFSPPTE